MVKKFKRITTLVIACVFVIVACAGFVMKSEPKPTDIKLTYQYWDLIPNQDKIFADFTKQYKEKTGINVTINGQYVTDAGWEDTLKAQIAAGSGPDVFHMDLNNFSAWKDVVIQPISQYYPSSFWSQFVPAAEDVWKSNGKYYAVSNSFSVVALLYNKDMFQKAGIKVNSTTTRWTLKEFETTMKKLYDTYKGKTVTYKDGKKYPYYVVGTKSLMYWWWLFWSYGGKSLDKTNNIAQKAYVDAIMKMGDYTDNGWVTAAADVQPGKVATAFSTAANVAMYPTGDWTPTGFYRTDKGIGEAKNPLKVNYGSLTVPMGNDLKVHAEMYNQGVVMNKNLTGYRAQAAAEFIKYMTTTDAWLGARGPEVGGLGIPAKKTWNTLYSTKWFDKPDQRTAFVWEANHGVISSPDYKVMGVDLYTPVQDALDVAYNAAIKPGKMDVAAVRQQVIEKLEAGQKSINTQLSENDIKLDNPSAKVK